jgi:signal transduction histidine kinase
VIQAPSPINFLTKVYSRLLLAVFSLVPSSLISYLYLFQKPPLRFENHGFHEIAISISILEGAFISYVTWRCYRYSGESFLRWLTLGFLGFTLVYAPHGLFTAYSHHNLWLFLLYGPASRLVMDGCFLIALLVYGKPAETEERRANKHYWWVSIGIFLLIDVAVAGIAISPVAGNPAVRSTMEIGALCLSALGLVILIARRIRSPLMTIFYSLSLACFAQSSLAFVLARAWNHLWWLAHAIFAAGFLLLSYGVIQAFRTTRSFATVYSQEDLMERAVAANAATQQALGRLQDAHVALARKAEELSRSNVLLDQAKRELEHTNAELEAFSSSVAHDLRAPIRAIDGFTRILIEDFSAQLPPTARQYLNDIRQSACAMSQMVKDLLKLSRLQYQKLSLQATPLNDLVESVLRDIKAEFSSREIEWRIGALPVVNCDPGLVRQVFANLLSNAVKFTRNQKPAVIQVEQMTSESELIILVRDNGIGFDPNVATKLFGLFVRLHDVKDFEGTGVGLATVQRIVQKHGGRVWADSLPGQGATFYFSLQEAQTAHEKTEYAVATKES